MSKLAYVNDPPLFVYIFMIYDLWSRRRYSVLELTPVVTDTFLELWLYSQQLNEIIDYLDNCFGRTESVYISDWYVIGDIRSG